MKCGKNIMAQTMIFAICLILIQVVLSQGQLCGPGEVYSECGSACPKTCANRGQPPIACPAVCRIGCFCRDGLVRNANGICVSPQQCPPRPGGVYCRPDEVFRECGSACPLTCANRNRPPRPCPDVCSRGCFCKPGLVRDSYRNCVLPQQCPQPGPAQVCGRNEIYSTCVVPCNDCKIRGKCQFLVCNRGCDCKPGFFRNMAGICIPANECPARPVY